MAVFRQPPTCSKCGKPYNGIYRDQSKLPITQRLIGDTFLRWDIDGHVCDPPLTKDQIKWHQDNKKVVEKQAAEEAAKDQGLRALFVPWKIAIRLKNLGFNEPCFAYYWELKDTFHFSVFYKEHNHMQTRVSAPLWQQVLTWLDQKKVYVDIDHEFGEDWSFCVDNGGNGHSGDEEIYPSRLIALETAILKALEILQKGANKTNYRGVGAS